MNLIVAFEALWTGAGSGLLISVLRKLVMLKCSNNSDAVDVKLNEFYHEEKLSFKMQRLFFCFLCSLIMTGALTLSLLLKLLSRK